MNLVTLTGRLTKKPELKSTTTGKNVCEFDLAVSRVKSDETDFIRCQVWGVQAENLNLYQDKGNMIGVSGSYRVDKFTDNQGNTKYKNYVLVNNIEYLQSKNKNVEQENAQKTTTQNMNEIVLSDSDLPF